MRTKMPKTTSKNYTIKNTHRDALISACKSGRINIVRHIIFTFNHNFDFKDKYGLTPKDYAKMYGHEQIVDFIESLKNNNEN
jgi:ankyrin repeat protein